ncbi:MAG: 16S rRNA (guanine(527)-N(7))-methyltransferase RsmG [Rhodanobacteraceae bacterium]
MSAFFKEHIFLDATVDYAILQRQLEDGVAALRLGLPAGAIARQLDYLELLQRWNGAYNLTAVRDPGEMVTRHLLDSLAILPFVEGDTLADVGSGAGLPGIPLAIAAPERRVTLVDSHGKKTRFLREAARALPLPNVRVEQGRVQDLQGTFGCITARAFASLAEMLAWGGHALAPAGVWLALKGRIDEAELAAVPAPFRVAAVHGLDVPGLDAQRHVVEIRRCQEDYPVRQA